MTGKPSKFAQQNDHAAERKAAPSQEKEPVKEPQKDPKEDTAVTEKTK